MIATRAEILTMLGIASTATDDDVALVEMIHGDAEAAVREYLGYDPEYGERTEYLPSGPILPAGELADFDRPRTFSGGAIRDLQLRHLPVFADGLQVWVGDSLLTYGHDYCLDIDSMLGPYRVSRSGIVTSRSGWPATPRAIKIVFQAGYDQQKMRGPGRNIRTAVIKTAVKAFGDARSGQRSVERGRTVSETVGKYRVDFEPATESTAVALTPEACQLLEPFRNYGLIF